MLLIVCAGVVLASLDLFIVNVALPDMAADLHAGGLGDLSWVLNAYAIVYASLLVLFGRLSERYPRELGFLLGVALFTAASAACGAATSVPMLVAFRIVQAAGAALLTPTSLGLVLATASPERRHGAVRAWTAIGGLAAALGPVVGGLLVAASWRWVFFVNVPIGLLALVVGWRRLPRVAGHPVPFPDGLGALLVTAGVAALSLGLVKGEDWGWGSAATVGVLAFAALALALFVGHCLRARNPLVDPKLFRVRTFSGASTVMLLFSVAFGAMLLSIVLWDQTVWGWSALQTGLAIAPGPLMVPLFSFLVAGRLIARYGSGAVIAAGAALFALGVAWWALAAGPTPDYVGDMLGGMLLTGVGVGLTLPTLMATAASLAAPDVVCDRVGRGQHAAASRAGHRRGRAGGGARHARLAARRRCGLPVGLDADRRDDGAGRPRGRRLAAGAATAPRAGHGRVRGLTAHLGAGGRVPNLDEMPTRSAFVGKLAQLETLTLSALDLVAASLKRALAALEHRDAALAQRVVADDDHIDRCYRDVNAGVLDLLATQAPVATDLRLATALLCVVGHVERMGDQCVNLAKMSMVAGSAPFDRALLMGIERMGTLALSEITHAQYAFVLRDPGLAFEVVRDHERVASLDREIFARAAHARPDGADVGCALSAVLICRALSRIDDNAVAIAEQGVFVVTGQLRGLRGSAAASDPA